MKNEEKVPASLVNIEAEAQVLGALMADNSLVDKVADILAGKDFIDPVHTQIYSVIVRDVSRGHVANPVTLKNYFIDHPGMEKLGGPSYLARLTGDAAICSPIDLAKLIAELARRRIMHEGLTKALADCSDVSKPIVDIVSEADGALQVSEKQTINQPTLGEAATQLIRNFGKPIVGVKCGQIPSLDEAMGLIRPSYLAIAAGRPGMGKSAMAISYGIGAARMGHGVLFVSLEMNADQIAARALSDMCYDGFDGVPYSGILEGNLTPDQMKRVCAAEQEFQRLPFHIIDTGSLTIGRLNMLVRRHKRKMRAKRQKLELVIVDYLQLLRPDDRRLSQYEAVSEISRSLKEIAKNNELGVFALAQLSRSVEQREDKRPMMSDLRDSGQIEQDADLILFLLRREYYLKKSEPMFGDPKYAAWEENYRAVQGQIEFIVAKRRQGVEGIRTGQFLGEFQAVRG